MNLHNELAEKFVLASILSPLDDSKKVYEKIKNLVKPEDFYLLKNRLIFQAISDLYDKNENINLVSVCQRLLDKKELDKVEESYLKELAELLPTTNQVTYYAKVIRELSIVRKIVSLLNDAILKIQISEIEEIKEYLKDFINDLKSLVECLENENKDYKKTEFDKIFDKIEIFFAKALNNPSTNFEKFVNSIFQSLENKKKYTKRKEIKKSWQNLKMCYNKDKWN